MLPLCLRFLASKKRTTHSQFDRLIWRRFRRRRRRRRRRFRQCLSDIKTTDRWMHTTFTRYLYTGYEDNTVLKGSARLQTAHFFHNPSDFFPNKIKENSKISQKNVLVQNCKKAASHGHVMRLRIQCISVFLYFK